MTPSHHPHPPASLRRLMVLQLLGLLALAGCFGRLLGVWLVRGTAAVPPLELAMCGLALPLLFLVILPRRPWVGGWGLWLGLGVLGLWAVPVVWAALQAGVWRVDDPGGWQGDRLATLVASWLVVVTWLWLLASMPGLSRLGAELASREDARLRYTRARVGMLLLCFAVASLWFALRTARAVLAVTGQ